LKHIAEPYERLYFRGERRLYNALSPSAYRDIGSPVGQNKRHSKINAAVNAFRDKCSIFGSFDQNAHEPLLQHYGIRTTWVDLVDNIWVALWFAVYQAHSYAKGRYLHFDLRRPADGDEYGYILLVATDDDRRRRTRKGFMSGNRTELVDLRVAAPSVFIRPHAQHGLLFRPRAIRQVNDGYVRPLDYSSHVRGIVRFCVEDGIRWLGQGEVHSIRGLFPPPYFDNGYSILLGAEIDSDAVGSVFHIGA
jgi:hypothetical protein